jgi:hypothetical protein
LLLYSGRPYSRQANISVFMFPWKISEGRIYPLPSTQWFLSTKKRQNKVLSALCLLVRLRCLVMTGRREMLHCHNKERGC